MSQLKPMDFKYMIVKIQNKCYCKKGMGQKKQVGSKMSSKREKIKSINKTKHYKALQPFCTSPKGQTAYRGHKTLPLTQSSFKIQTSLNSQRPYRCQNQDQNHIQPQKIPSLINSTHNLLWL